MPLTFQRLTSGKPYIAGSTVEVFKGRKEDIELAERLATKYEGKIARAVQALLDAASENLDIKVLIDALQSGSADKVLAIVDAALDAAQAAMNGQILQGLQDAAWDAGIATALALPGKAAPLVRAEFNFDRLSPNLVRWLQDYDLGLIRQINDTTKESIRDILVANISAGKPPAAQARQIKETIGLTTRQAKAVTNYRKELEGFHTKRSAAGWGLGKGPDKVNGHSVFRPGPDGKPKDGVLERRLRDLRYDSSLTSAMATKKPIPPAKIDAMVAAYAKRYRAYRATTIARTESMRTTNAGILESWRQAIEKGIFSEDLIRRRWIVTKDERTCAICAPIPGMNPEHGVKFAQPFATPVGPVMSGPVHPSCRCTQFVYSIELSQLAKGW